MEFTTVHVLLVDKHYDLCHCSQFSIDEIGHNVVVIMTSLLTSMTALFASLSSFFISSIFAFKLLLSLAWRCNKWVWASSCIFLCRSVQPTFNYTSSSDSFQPARRVAFMSLYKLCVCDNIMQHQQNYIMTLYWRSDGSSGVYVHAHV